MKNKSIRKRLAAAMCALAANPAFSADEDRAVENDWVIDSSVLHYAEDQRISVTKSIVTVDGNVSNTDNVKIDVVFDTMTGATPTGAVNTPGVIVAFSGTSGGGGTASNNGALELTPFDDTRLAVGLDWEHYTHRRVTHNFGGSISVEGDWRSFGGSWKYSRESEDKRNTYVAGVAYTYDEIYMLGGGTPEPLSPTLYPSIFGNGSRSSIDFLTGISRVLNRRTVGQLNLYASTSEGYHSDPYKVVSVIDHSMDLEVDRYYEGRPEERTRYAIQGKIVHRMPNKIDTANVSYRFYDDDWQITSHTIDVKYRRDLGMGKFFEPHLRLYHQSAAYFFMHDIPFGESPEFASADSRLDEMLGITLGIKYGFPLGERGKFRIRAEYIDQSFSEAEFKKNTAYLFQLNYQKEF